MRKKRNALVIQEAIAGYVFVLPALILFLTFFAGPMVWGLGMSFFKWDFFSTPKLVWLDNFRDLWNDKLFMITLQNTVKFAFIVSFLNVSLGMLIAIGINNIHWTWLQTFLRSAYFMPFVISTTVTAILFTFLLNESLGAVNYYLTKIGIPRIPWLTSSTWAFVSVVFLDVWKSVGLFTLIFLAGLQGIPTELYEAAEVDGAPAWVKVTRITIPLLAPTLFFCTIVALIGSFQVFESMYVLTGGGPCDATRTMTMYLYRAAFGDYNMGYAASMAVVLFMILLTLTIIQIRLGKHWVFYR